MRSRESSPRSQPSIALIGLRGVGKRSLGFIAASHLGRRFVSEGLVFTKKTGLSKAEYLAKHGEKAFFQRVIATLRQLFEEHGQDSVIECGIATIAAAGRELLLEFAKTHPVIYITRYQFSDHGPQSFQITQNRETDRDHRQCSQFEFNNLEDVAPDQDSSLSNTNTSSPVLRRVKEDFCAYVDRIVGGMPSWDRTPFTISSIPIERRGRTYTSRVKLSTLVSNTSADLLDFGQDALELEIDIFGQEQISALGVLVSNLRRTINMPLIISTPPLNACSENSGGLFQVLKHAMRLAVDFVAVDCNMDEVHVRALLSEKGNTKLIADAHFAMPQQHAWKARERLQLSERVQKLGFDAIRLTQPLISRADNDDIQHFISVARDVISIPIIAYNLGYQGRSSQVRNCLFTPVRHSMQEISKEPPNIPALQQATSFLFESFEYDALEFHIFGQSVTYSRSPLMYKSAFSLYGMKHDYICKDSTTFQEAMTTAQSFYFGGAAITFPYKEQAFRACVATSDSARVIGSINTLIPLRQVLGTSHPSLSDHAASRNQAGIVTGFYGANTDWLAIHESIRQKLSPHNIATVCRSTGLVLGAGGSARSAIYALLQLGLKTVYVCNRTPSRAATVAKHFNEWCLSQDDRLQAPRVRTIEANYCSSLDSKFCPIVIVSCIPTTAALFGPNMNDTAQLNSWLRNPAGGVVADVSYDPPLTPLLSTVQFFAQTTSTPWSTVSGLEIVYEQALPQFELLTGRRAPKHVMRAAMA